MTWIINFLKSFFDTIISLVDFVITLVKGLIDFLADLPNYVSTIIHFINFLPTQIVVFASLSITLSIIFLILGRSRSN